MYMKLQSLESSSFSYLPPVGILEGHTLAFILPLQASPGRVLAEVMARAAFEDGLLCPEHGSARLPRFHG